MSKPDPPEQCPYGDQEPTKVFSSFQGKERTSTGIRSSWPSRHRRPYYNDEPPHRPTYSKPSEKPLPPIPPSPSTPGKLATAFNQRPSRSAVQPSPPTNCAHQATANRNHSGTRSSTIAAQPSSSPPSNPAHQATGNRRHSDTHSSAIAVQSWPPTNCPPQATANHRRSGTRSSVKPSEKPLPPVPPSPSFLAKLVTAFNQRPKPSAVQPSPPTNRAHPATANRKHSGTHTSANAVQPPPPTNRPPQAIANHNRSGAHSSAIAAQSWPPTNRPHQAAGNRKHSSTPGSPPPPRYSLATSLPLYTAGPTCVVCKKKPPYSNAKTGRSYSTCGLTCASKLAQQETSSPNHGADSPASTPARSGSYYRRRRPLSQPQILNDQALNGYSATRPTAGPIQPNRPVCVVCEARSTHRDYVTCGLKCVEKLCKDGGDPTMCDYCHRKPKDPGSEQCGNTCAEKAKLACLLCKCRPKKGVKHHLCGKTCRRIAMKSTPLILEAPKGHKTYEMVEKKFQKAWHTVTGPAPTIKKVFKIIENDEFLKPYTIYKEKVGNEHFRYHGTGRQCQLGVSTTQLCATATCPVCNILKTSFKISHAKTSGAFGAGIYSSSASNKAYSYTGGTVGAMLLTKVVLGKIKTVKGWNEVMSCPSGYDSVVFDRMKGQLNETIVYTDDAIRPVFLIMF